MNVFKLLIDTNIVIGLEDAQPVSRSLSELVRLSSQYNVGLYVHSANYDDIHRDRDPRRREITLSKIAKFQKLSPIDPKFSDKLSEKYGVIANDNDLSDVRLLLALEAKAIDFLVTEDIRLTRRGARAGLSSNIFSIDDALEWIQQSFQQTSIRLPYVEEKKAYQIDKHDPILISLRGDYVGFDSWFEKCCREHRDCWTLEVDDKIAGILIRKDENHQQAGTRYPGKKILKICTFKVTDEFRGEKFGELLLKQVLWFSQINKYDLVYLTAFPKHEFLIDLLSFYGFESTLERNGELVLEKKIYHNILPNPGSDIVGENRKVYPRFYDLDTHTRRFWIPIKPSYHQRLFPEILKLESLPLFPTDSVHISSKRRRIPGNTIRKTYLCRSKNKKVNPGDVVIFYMSKAKAFISSQSITTISVVEKISLATNVEELVRKTAKRSVFETSELNEMNPTSENPVLVIDFLLIGHLQNPINLRTLVQNGIFNGSPPQSIAQISLEKYQKVKPLLDLGYQI